MTWTRTAFVQKVTSRQREFYERVRRAIEKAQSLVHPDADLDRATRDMIAQRDTVVV